MQFQGCMCDHSTDEADMLEVTVPRETIAILCLVLPALRCGFLEVDLSDKGPGGGADLLQGWRSYPSSSITYRRPSIELLVVCTCNVLITVQRVVCGIHIDNSFHSTLFYWHCVAGSSYTSVGMINRVRPTSHFPLYYA